MRTSLVSNLRTGISFVSFRHHVHHYHLILSENICQWSAPQLSVPEAQNCFSDTEFAPSLSVLFAQQRDFIERAKNIESDQFLLTNHLQLRFLIERCYVYTLKDLDHQYYPHNV